MLNWKILMIHFREISTLQSTMKGKGDEEMQHIQVFLFFSKYIAEICLSLLLFFTWSLLFAGSPHHERPVDPRVEADVVEGLRKPENGRDRDATLWQLWYWWCCLRGKFCEIRAAPGVATSKAAAHTTTNSRHRQIFPPAKEEEDGRQTSWSRL